MSQILSNTNTDFILKKQWSLEEDALLVELVEEHGATHW